MQATSEANFLVMDQDGLHKVIVTDSQNLLRELRGIFSTGSGSSFQRALGYLGHTGVKADIVAGTALIQGT